VRELHGVDAYSVVYEGYFEPYVVAPKSMVPSYDERFRGYGLNKISHLHSMAASGFCFHVVDDRAAFVAAEAHPRSASWKAMYAPDVGAEHRARVATHWANFKEELRSVQNSGLDPGCDTAMATEVAQMLPTPVVAPLPAKRSLNIGIVVEASTTTHLTRDLELHCRNLARSAMAA